MRRSGRRERERGRKAEEGGKGGEGVERNHSFSFVYRLLY